MSGSVGTMRGGSNRHSGSKEKNIKIEKGSGSKQKSSQMTIKTDSQSNKVHPTPEQIIMAQRLNTNQTDADPKTKKLVDELMELTGKSEDVVVIALHDAENDADRAVNMLLEGGDEQRGEWREQGGKRKKKATTQKDGSNQANEEHEGRNNKDRGDREEKDQDGGTERFDAPPRRGRQNGGPPPRLARGRGRDRGNFGERENRERNNTEEWDIDKGDERRERSGSDRGRPRGRGFGGKRGGGGGRGRFNNSTDRDNRSFNRVPRFEKANHSQPLEGPEIDTWTNETAETNTNKDTDWDNWNDTWVNEEDQWTGTLEETKVFTPSQMKIPEPDPVINEPPSSLGQRLDVGSLFIESAKYSKAPDYSKPNSDAYITQFNQAATESIKNTIGIGSASRPPASLNSLTIPQQSTTNTLGLSSLTQSSGHVQGSVLGNLSQQGSQSSMSQTINQLSQISQSSNQAISQMALSSQQQTGRDQAAPAQSRISSVMQQQQQNIPTSMSASLQQRPKPQRSKLPPPSKIPSSAVEMPGHIPRNPQLDLQFGIDFSSDSGTSFGFGTGSDDGEVPNTYPSSNSNGTQSVISNHLSQAHVAKSNDSNSMVLNMKSSPSAGSNKVLSPMEPQQSNRQTAVFHNSVYTSSPPKNDNQSLDREQNKLEHKSSPMLSQRSGSLPQSKESTNYPTANGYAPSYQAHQKATSISQTQAYTHTTNSQPPQSTNFSGQYPASQSYPSNLSAPPGTTQYPPAQPPQFNNAQNQYASGQGQFASTGSSSHPSIPHANHQSQYSTGAQSSYSSGGQSQYSSYQNTSSFPTQQNYPSSNQSGGSNSTLYPVATQSSGSSYSSQSNSYQSPSAGSYHARDSQQNAAVTTQSNAGVTYQTASQSVSLKAASSQTNTNYNSQNFTPAPVTLQPSSMNNKLGESLSKMTLKDTASMDGHQSVQYDHSNTSTTVSTSMSLPSSTSSASLSTGTTTISSTSTATSITPTSRIASMPSTSKAPPNLPPGVPLMGQYIMGQSTMPPYFTVPPLYGFEHDMLLQQRMPMQTGSYYDIGAAFPAPAGSALPTGRDQQQPLTTVSFSGTSADSSKMNRVDAQSPNSTSQPQNAQQIPINFHYGYYYPSMFPGATSIQYPPVFPVTPVTNTAAHTGATGTAQFQKTFASVYAPKGYDELNQAQDFSKTGYGSSSSTGKSSGTRAGTSEITQNAYNKTHSQAFDKQGFHGGTPPPFNLPLATATQAGPMAAPTTPYGAPFVPVMAAHQPHSQMMHHPIQQDSNSSSSRGLNQGNQTKAGGAKGYGAPQYWNN